MVLILKIMSLQTPQDSQDLSKGVTKNIFGEHPQKPRYGRWSKKTNGRLQADQSISYGTF